MDALQIHSVPDRCVISVAENSVSHKSSKFTSNECIAVMKVGFGWPRKSFSKHLFFLQTWLRCYATFSANFAQSFLDLVLLYRDTRRKFTAATLRLSVVLDVKSSSRTEAISKFTCEFGEKRHEKFKILLDFVTISGSLIAEFDHSSNYFKLNFQIGN